MTLPFRSFEEKKGSHCKMLQFEFRNYPIQRRFVSFFFCRVASIWFCIQSRFGIRKNLIESDSCVENRVNWKRVRSLTPRSPNKSNHVRVIEINLWKNHIISERGKKLRKKFTVNHWNSEKNFKILDKKTKAASKLSPSSVFTRVD